MTLANGTVPETIGDGIWSESHTSIMKPLVGALQVVAANHIFRRFLLAETVHRLIVLRGCLYGFVNVLFLVIDSSNGIGVVNLLFVLRLRITREIHFFGFSNPLPI